jgi:hypothetical protein
MIPEDRRGWYLVALIIALVLAVGALVATQIKEPVSRPFDYGTAPFAPGQSHNSTTRGAP